jgi:dTDP-glucose 4,6-dehydratase
VRWYLDSRAWWQSILDRGYKAERIGLAVKAEPLS